VTTTIGPRQLPALEANQALVVPPSVERTLSNGLTVIVIERRSVPLVELRLRLPFARSELDSGYVARAALMSQTLFSGTADMSTVDIAAALQTVGGALSAGVDADRLLVSGNGLADGLERILQIMADVLNGATFPEGEVTDGARPAARPPPGRPEPTGPPGPGRPAAADVRHPPVRGPDAHGRGGHGDRARRPRCPARAARAPERRRARHRG
jgi:hypothetical protein